ncbi:MAG: FprA family A-type flavoprotein [Muribaculaceae bacterium]|nr:FprA family A-type flavoprotein [Muribaculaceae bacterium]
MHSLTPNILFVGAEDDSLDLFEGQYPIPNGVSYNSYLIRDSRSAIIDSVDARRTADWLAAIEAALPGLEAAPEYLVVQHMEPDHSGSVRALAERFPDIKIVCTAKAAAMLGNFFEGFDFATRAVIVGDGDTLSLGNVTLQFITAPMVHWPEVMMTLDLTDGVLFSADAFGTFGMSNSATGDAWDFEARRYYTNIVGRFGASVQGVMKKIKDLKFGVVAPLHGPVLRENLAHYWHLYDRWSRYEPETRGVMVAYASVYGGTAEAARRLAAILRNEGAGEVVLFDLCRHDVSYAVSEAFRLSHIVLCSVTYDGDIFPAMHDFLHHLQRKNLGARTFGLVENGSWAPVAARIMTEMVSKLKDTKIVAPTVTLRSRLHHDDIPTLQALARELVSTL